jgi:hypothetical protein
MGDTSQPVTNVDNDRPLSFPSSLSEACEVAPHAFKERMALIEKTVSECGKSSRFTARWVMENTRLWIFVDGDEAILDPARPCDIRSDYGDYTLPGTDYALLRRALQTTPALRIAMIIWLVITSPDPDVDDSDVDDWAHSHSDWEKWDIQGRAITLWADTFSKVMRSKKRPSDAIVTEPNALLAFQSAMERAGHQHDYQINPDVGAWVMMLAAFPELKREDLADVHFNDEDGCSLCADLLYVIALGYVEIF